LVNGKYIKNKKQKTKNKKHKMKTVNVSTPTNVSTVPVNITFGNNTFRIRDFGHDLKITNALTEFRVSNGLPAPRNAFSWWKYVLVSLTYVNVPITFKEAIDGQIRINQSASGLLASAARGIGPDEVQREYTKGLPRIVSKTGLKIGRLVHTGSRPALTFYLRDNVKARQWLLENHPDTVILFNYLDKKFGFGGSKLDVNQIIS
jgi:hypothetical protein